MTAVIPRNKRISACTSIPTPDGGVTMTLATRETYLRHQYENGPWDLGLEHESPAMRGWVRVHGISVSQELFDTVWPGVPFAPREVRNELMTLEPYKPKTRSLILDAVLRWLCKQPEAQVKKIRHGLYQLH